MNAGDNLITFSRPMPIEHRVVYGLFGCLALFFAAWIAQAQFEHLGESSEVEETGWHWLAVLVALGLPLIAAAVIGGVSEVVLDRPARELREVSWVGPVPAWRQSHPFAEVGEPRILPDRVVPDRDGTAPLFKLEIPVKKNHGAVPVGSYPTREEAETVAAAIRAALAPETLPPFRRSTTDQLRARLGNILMLGGRGPR